MVVTFFRGHPTNSLLPSAEVAKAASAVLMTSRPTDEDETTRHPLTYGADEGALSVRETLAKWINRRLGDTATAGCVNLTNGASFGANTALVQCCPRGYTQASFVVSPTYYLINTILENAGFDSSHAVVEDPSKGLDLAGFEKKLAELELKNPTTKTDPLKFRYVLYLVPTFSNPGGYTLTLAERHELLAIARKYNVLVLCDEVYNLLDYGDKASGQLPLLVTLDRATLPKGSLGNVIGNFTMSKYLGPGLRVGWQVAATPELGFHLSQSGANVSGGTPAQLSTFIVQELVETGAADEIIAGLNDTYGQRARAYREAFETYLPKGTAIEGGKGGYFFWLKLPSRFNVDSITAECKQQGVVLAPGNHFEVKGDKIGWGQRYFRVSLSYHPADEAVPAIKLWGKVCEQNANLTK